jgi:hypothetical protein
MRATMNVIDDLTRRVAEGALVQSMMMLAKPALKREARPNLVTCWYLA